MPEINYLGHMLNSHGVMSEPNKIATMIQWLLPTSVKYLREFLGFTGYYYKFIKNYGTITASHTDLL